MQTSATAAETSLRCGALYYLDAEFTSGTYHIMTITLNLTNSVKIGIIPTAMEVPTDDTVNGKLDIVIK
jgi:hypothetical protein